MSANQQKELQKRVAQAIVNIFETGKAQGEYGQVTLLAGDSGHLTYGRAQTTLGSGNLFLLIKDYCEAPGAQFAEELRPFLERLLRRDTGLDRHAEFRRLLRRGRRPGDARDAGQLLRPRLLEPGRRRVRR
jgi:chitosanase